MVKIFDGFIYYNEVDLLDVRFHELNRAVDYFIVVESTKTFSGQNKPLFFRQHYDRFRAFHDKIIHIVVDDMPETNDPWVREAFQRNAMTRGLGAAADDDILIVSDVDEIPRGTVVEAIRDDSADAWLLRMPLAYFMLNYVSISGQPHIPWSFAVRKKRLTTPEILRCARHRLISEIFYGSDPVTMRMINHAGWHFSFFGDDEFVRNKIKSYSHQEYNNESFLDSISIEDIIKSNGDLFNRAGFRWMAVDFDEYFPEFIRSNRYRFDPYIIKDCKVRIDSSVGGNALTLAPCDYGHPQGGRGGSRRVPRKRIET